MKKFLLILTLLGIVVGTAACTATQSGPETRDQQMERLLNYADQQQQN